MKKNFFVSYFILFFLLCASCFSEENSMELFVDDFGISKSEELNSGFVFFDGKYIDAPYVVERKGLGLFINDVMLEDYSNFWPIKEPEVITDDFELPEDLNENSSFEDIEDSDNPQNSHWIRKQRFLFNKYPEDIAKQKMLEYFKSLPFVSNVSENGLVETKRGKKQYYQIIPFHFEKRTKESVLERVDSRKNRFEKRLRKGDCFFLFSKGRELSFGQGKSSRVLRVTIEILRSQRSTDEKINLLQRLNILPPLKVKESHMLIVTCFEASNQLEKRIEELIKETRAIPKTYEDIPEKNPELERQKKLQELLKKEKERQNKLKLEKQKQEGN